MLLLIASMLLFLALFLAISGLLRTARAPKIEKGSFRRMLDKIGTLNSRLELHNYRDGTRRKLDYAGYPDLSVDSFLAVKELAGVILLAILIYATGNISPVAVLVPVIGFFLPDLWLGEKVSRRKNGIIRELPYFLDMVALCVEAGLDFGAAINRILEKSSRTPLTREISIMQQEIKVGTGREEALRNLAARTDIQEVSSFISSLIQADRTGASLGQTLRVQSEQIRTAIFQKAEKTAHEAPVKMLFPMVLFIFPVIFIVLLGPVVLQMIGR